MIDLKQLQVLASLIDTLEIELKKLETCYGKNDSEGFNRSKKEILDIQNKISKMTQ
jgi:hypothetical protein